MKSLAYLLSAFALLALVSGAARADEPLAHTKESLEQVKKNVEAGKAVIVDVREPNETDAGHLKGAILLPQSKLRVQSQVSSARS